MLINVRNVIYKKIRKQFKRNFHQDNVQSHVSTLTSRTLLEFAWYLIQQPRYSPHIYPPPICISFNICSVILREQTSIQIKRLIMSIYFCSHACNNFWQKGLKSLQNTSFYAKTSISWEKKLFSVIHKHTHTHICTYVYIQSNTIWMGEKFTYMYNHYNFWSVKVSTQVQMMPTSKRIIDAFYVYINVD